jgi:hypothetical protein
MEIGHQLTACGKKGLPKTIRVNDVPYRQVHVYKHDFFAATARYQRVFEGGENDSDLPHTESVILKINRESDLFGFSMSWLGEWISAHESKNLRSLQGIAGVPRFVSRYGRCGLVYQYVAGQTLDEYPVLPDRYFDQLTKLLESIHARRMAYVDMNKKGNIIVTPDGRPYLIDFQVSWRGHTGLAVLDRMLGVVLRRLQQEDFYHLKKHKRRFRPDLMTEDEIRKSRKFSFWIRMHRLWIRPLTNMRRKLLGYLYRKGHIVTDLTEIHPETDPSRWAKRSN